MGFGASLSVAERSVQEDSTMKKLTQKMVGAAVFAAVGLVALPRVFALGFDNPDQDARATAQGEAFVAQADDASAIYYNPAGLTQLTGTEFTSGMEVTFPDSRLKGGGSGAEMNTMSYIPQMFLASDLGLKQSPWRFGLGFTIPFGNASDYSKNGPFRYLVTSASLVVYDIQPTVAFQVNDHLSLGASLHAYIGDTRLSQKVPFTPLPDGNLHFGGTGEAFGASAGLLWKITPQHSIGLLYRSPFDINLTGDATLKTPVGDQTAHSSADIPFPQFVKGGYAFRPIPQLKLEADVEWINWETLNSLKLHAPGAAFNGTTIPFSWKDSWYYEFGAQYDITEHWAVRGGYIYSINTVPNNTFSPSVPDSNRHVFSVGGGYSTKRISLDLVYQYSLSEDRTVNNGTAADGAWVGHSQQVMVTSSVKF
jgi:long-chain fatty acid transport protein